ncbi:MAG: hypothetical protein NPIRA02_29420 [Nitrospirales bacterium]|nr:MAG: hypothetical protein NPIRA02_29420 [Nitrospirales bacterium]
MKKPKPPRLSQSVVALATTDFETFTQIMRPDLTVREFKIIQKRLRLTNKTMARALRVDENTVNRWRMGLHPVPPWVADRLHCLIHHEHTTAPAATPPHNP